MTIIYDKLTISGLYLKYTTYSKGMCVNFTRKSTKRKINRLKNIKDSVRRTKKTITDLLECNEDMDKFITLTYRNEPKSIELAYFDLKNFLKRLNYFNGQGLKYLALPERGAKTSRLHFHIVCNSRYIANSLLAKMWREGFVSVKKIKYGELIPYLIKYINKDLIVNFSKRRFYCSRTLKRPYILMGYEAVLIYNYFLDYFKLLGSYIYKSKYQGDINVKKYRINCNKIDEYIKEYFTMLYKPPNYYNNFKEYPLKQMALI